MHKFPRWITIPVAAVMLSASSFSVASAVDITDRKVTVMSHGTYFKCYHNYNLFETYILGKQDGWRFTLDEC